MKSGWKKFCCFKNSFFDCLKKLNIFKHHNFIKIALKLRQSPILQFRLSFLFQSPSSKSNGSDGGKGAKTVSFVDDILNGGKAI